MLRSYLSHSPSWYLMLLCFKQLEIKWAVNGLQPFATSTTPQEAATPRPQQQNLHSRSLSPVPQLFLPSFITSILGREVPKFIQLKTLIIITASVKFGSNPLSRFTVILFIQVDSQTDGYGCKQEPSNASAQGKEGILMYSPCSHHLVTLATVLQ